MSGPIRVRRLPGHPLVMPERHATRPSPMHDTPPPLFPDWFSPNDILSHFELVDRDPQVTIITMSYHQTPDDLRRIRSPGTPLVVVYTLDDLHEPSRGGWDRSPDWSDAVRSFALGADLLVGAQLPIDVPHDNVLALPHAPVVPFRDTAGSVAAATTDLYFAGAWYPHRNGVPADSRDRTYRDYLVKQLRNGLPARSLELRRVHYWRTNPLRPGGPPPAAGLKAELLRQHESSLDHTRISLAPVGYGYYTTRHSDTFARGRALLSEPIHHHLRLPDPDRWASGEVALFYSPRADDIVEVVSRALGEPTLLQSLAEAGWRYGQQYLRPDRQAARLAAAIRQLL
ncbi:MAG TPA: glycosyltransferase [Pseudonocardiaceae bacterium]|jgi:hypothetical protein